MAKRAVRRKAYVILDEDFIPWSLCMSRWAATMRMKSLVKLTKGESQFHVVDVPLDKDMFLARRYKGDHWLISTGPHGQLEPFDGVCKQHRPTKYVDSLLG